MGAWTKLKRLFDDHAWLGQLYVTNRCNLDCHYCNEFENSQPHPTLEELTKWMNKMRELGVMKIQLQGGEPLLHPDIVEIVRRAKAIGFYRVGMSSNGFLLTESLVKDLEKTGLDSLQVSVDRMTPSLGTKKSLKTVLHKLDYFMDVTFEDLKSWDRPKNCQKGCGVYCVISASFRSNHPLKDGYDEVREWLWKRSAARKRERRNGGPSEVRRLRTPSSCE